MKRLLSVGFVAAMVLSSGLFAAKKTKVSFDEKAALSYIKVLASDSMLGRKSGHEGGRMAEEYIASKFKEWGLEPGGENNTYFQQIEFPYFNVEEGVEFKIILSNDKRSFYYGEDWRVVRYSGSGTFTKEIVFVGYGISAPEKNFDEYKNINVKGKLVLMLADEPGKKLKEKVGDKANLENRVKEAQKKGAAGILFFSGSSQRSFPRIRVKKEVYRKDFVLLAVAPEVIDYIFKNLPTEPRVVLERIKKGTPVSFNTEVKVFLAVRTTFDPKRKARNILAKISGTDPVLKKEYVIIGAHMDHLGISPLGEVMNGANDNASGTAVVMEIARVLRLSGFKPKRTIVFALWAGEDQGLWGSKYYADHPLYPMEKTVTYINFDMVGQGKPEPVPFRGVYYGPQIWKVLKEKLPEEILKKVEASRGGPGGSDHTPFLMKGVPGFFIITRGNHLKYHHSRDDADLIKPEVLKSVGAFGVAAVKIIADAKENFFFPRRRETFYLKYQQLVNYRIYPAEKILKEFNDIKYPIVDVQFASVSAETSGDISQKLVSFIDRLQSLKQKISKAKGLKLLKFDYSPMRWRRRSSSKINVVLGLENVQLLMEKPSWAEIFAKAGIRFVVIDSAFSKETAGENFLKKLQKAGLLLVLKINDQKKLLSILKSIEKPALVISEDIPGEGVLKQIRKTDSTLGLIYATKEGASDYFKKLESLKKKLGFERVAIVSEGCLHEKRYQEKMKDLIAEMLKAKYERNDMRNLFSESLMRLLRQFSK